MSPTSASCSNVLIDGITVSIVSNLHTLNVATNAVTGDYYLNLCGKWVIGKDTNTAI